MHNVGNSSKLSLFAISSMKHFKIMLSENRKYHFVGELTLHQSKVINAPSRPKEDQVNWLFLNIEERQFSFVYKLQNPARAIYEEPFKADLAFTMIEAVQELINMNTIYNVSRGPELIGTIRIIRALN